VTDDYEDLLYSVGFRLRTKNLTFCLTSLSSVYTTW